MLSPSLSVGIGLGDKDLGEFSCCIFFPGRAAAKPKITCVLLICIIIGMIHALLDAFLELTWGCPLLETDR